MAFPNKGLRTHVTPERSQPGVDCQVLLQVVFAVVSEKVLSTQVTEGVTVAHEHDFTLQKYSNTPQSLDTECPALSLSHRYAKLKTNNKNLNRIHSTASFICIS